MNARRFTGGPHGRGLNPTIRVVLCVTAKLDGECPCGSEATNLRCQRDVRFPPDSNRIAAPHQVTLRAMSGVRGCFQEHWNWDTF